MTRISHGDVKVYVCVPCLREEASPAGQTAHWRRWLLAQLEPFLGQEFVKVSDLIERLHGQPVATPAKKGRAA